MHVSLRHTLADVSQLLVMAWYIVLHWEKIARRSQFFAERCFKLVSLLLYHM